MRVCLWEPGNPNHRLWEPGNPNHRLWEPGNPNHRLWEPGNPNHWVLVYWWVLKENLLGRLFLPASSCGHIGGGGAGRGCFARGGGGCGERCVHGEGVLQGGGGARAGGVGGARWEGGVGGRGGVVCKGAREGEGRGGKGGGDVFQGVGGMFSKGEGGVFSKGEEGMFSKGEEGILLALRLLRCKCTTSTATVLYHLPLPSSPTISCTLFVNLLPPLAFMSMLPPPTPPCPPLSYMQACTMHLALCSPPLALHVPHTSMLARPPSWEDRPPVSCSLLVPLGLRSTLCPAVPYPTPTHAPLQAPCPACCSAFLEAPARRPSRG